MRTGEPIFKKTFTKPLPKGAKIFSRKHIKYARYTDASGKVQELPLNKDGKKHRCETSRWYIRFYDHESIKRVLKAYPDKSSCDYLYGRIQELVKCLRRKEHIPTALQEYLGQDPGIRDQLIGFGLLNKTIGMVKTLDELVDDFKESLVKKERGQRYIDESARTLKTTFEDCNFKTWHDIKGEVLSNYLDDKRDGGKGISKRRYNNILGRVQQFCRWYVKQQKYNGDMNIINPVEYLDAKDNVDTDARHPRRALELDDFRRFLFAALIGPKVRKFTGRERNFLYRLAAETAMRKIDFNRLRVKDIDFDNNLIRIQASRIKNKTASTIYLRPQTAVELKQYCRNKLPEAKVFDMPKHPEQMVRFDLSNTVVKDDKGKVIIPAIPYKDKFGRVFDFHCLRHQSASLYGMNPETPEAVRQKLTRHKTADMVRHYTHASEIQQRQAVEALPDLTVPGSQSQVQIKTGTDKASLPNACFMDGKIRQKTTPYDKSEKINPTLSTKNADFKPTSKVENCSKQNSDTCINNENPHYSTKNPQKQNQLALCLLNDKDFRKVAQKWPKLSAELKAAILKMILCLMLIFSVGCQSLKSHPTPGTRQEKKNVIKLEIQKEKPEQIYNLKKWEFLATLIQKHFDTKNMTIEEIAAELAYQEYLLNKEKK